MLQLYNYSGPPLGSTHKVNTSDLRESGERPRGPGTETYIGIEFSRLRRDHN